MRRRTKDWAGVGALGCALALALPGGPRSRAGEHPSGSGGHGHRLRLLRPGRPGVPDRGSRRQTPTPRLRYALRPRDGTLGAPLEFPASLGKNSYPGIAFDAAGNGVISEQSDRQVFGYKASTGEMSAPQVLALGQFPARVSVAPTGEALIGLDNGSGQVRVAFRAAGLGAQVDTANTVDLSTSGGLVGLQLQADGGAIVVWHEGDTLKQAVRRGGGVQPPTRPRRFPRRGRSPASPSPVTVRPGRCSRGSAETTCLEPFARRGDPSGRARWSRPARVF